jgi:aldose 1-epimerase
MRLTSESATVELDPVSGGRVSSLQVLGHELLVTEGPGIFLWGSFPMAPWVGRTREGKFSFDGGQHELVINAPPHAMHGTVYGAPWTRVDEATLECDLGPEWPFLGKARQYFRLTDDRLSMTLEVHATDGPMPADCGWHPWFRRSVGGAPLELRAKAGAMLDTDESNIVTGRRVPIGPRPWASCFVDIEWPVVLTWPGVLQLEVHSTCPNVVLYETHELGVCVEPQTGPPDSLNLGPSIVAPGKPLVATCDLVWSALSG